MIDNGGRVVMGEGDQWGRGVETSPPAKGLSFIERGPMWGSSTPQRVGGVQSHHPWLSETGTSQV